MTTYKNEKDSFMQEKDTREKRPVKASLAVYQKRLELIEEQLDELYEHAIKGAIIVVEGKRDTKALRSLGLDGDFRLATHHPVVNFCEVLAKSGQTVILLTDWDRRGNLLASKIKKNLHSLGTNPDTRIRNNIISLVQKEIKDVESLPSYVEKLKIVTKNKDITDSF